MKKIKLNTLLIFSMIWLIGLLHIGYTGTQSYEHYALGTLMPPPPDAVLMTCGLFSVYFICGIIIRLSPFWHGHPYWAYIALSSVLMFQTFIAFIGAMHAPPYWGAFIVNSMFLLLFHFIFYPIYAVIRNKKQNTA